MKRRLLDIMALLSVLLCVLLIAAWVVTRTQSLMLLWLGSAPTERYLAFADRRGVELVRIVPLWAPARTLQDHQSWHSQHSPEVKFHWLGFEARVTPVAQSRKQYDPVILGSAYSLTIPYGPLCAGSLMMPIFRLVTAIRARRRIPDGHCLTCGYDLRASQGRCPECGTAIPPHAAAETTSA